MTDALVPAYCDFCDQTPPVGAILIQPSDGPTICETCVELCWRSIRIAQTEREGTACVPTGEYH